MFLKITKKQIGEKLYESAKIAESYLENGKNKQRIIRNLGPIKSNEDLLNYTKIVDSFNKKRIFVDLSKIKIISSKSYGIYYTVSELFKKYDIDKILKSNLQKGKHQFDVYAIIQALIVNRLENPLSKNKAFEYIQKDYPLEIDCKKEDLYSAMDVLEKQKETIELDIFNSLKDKLNLNLEHAHYDITSSYFEGHKCEIAAHGYSRDHRNDREQIVIGLVLVDNIPIYHEVFVGNTSDKTTVLNVFETLKTKFNLKNPTFVGDRGMFTQDIIENLEKIQENYILGFSKTGNKITEELLEKDIALPIGKDNCNAIFGKEEIVEYSKENIQKRNYILCIDKNTQKEQLENLDKIKEYINTNLTDLKSRYEKSYNPKNGSKISWDSFIKQVDKITSRNKRLFDIKYNHDMQQFSFELNTTWYAREQKAAGKFVIITNTNNVPLEVLKTYKELNNVESSFNVIKNQLELRPINHYKNERVKAHVFICVLALLIEKIMAKSLKNISPQTALEELKRIRKSLISENKFQQEFLTEISLEQKEIFKKLNLYVPLN